MRALSYANVASTAALVVALSGGAYAAGVLPKHSVGSPQLKPGAVGTKHLKAGAVDSGRIRDHSVTAADLAPGTVPAPATPVPAVPEVGAAQAGRAGASMRPLPGCQRTVLASRTVTPKQPSRVLAATGGHWVLNSEDPTHWVVATVRAEMEIDGVRYRTTGTAGSARGNEGQYTSLESTGLLHDDEGRLAVLQPGRTYTLEAVAQMSGVCAATTGAREVELTAVLVGNSD